MPVPSPRNKILPARGSFLELNASVASLLEGEICYATNEDQYYQKEGGVLVAVGATKAQGSLADSAVQPTDSIDILSDVDISTTAPTDGQALIWDNANGKFIPGEAGLVDSVNSQTGVVVLDTDDIGEGSTNLYSQWDNATGGINYASGNVGIGTNSPGARLQIENSGADANLVINRADATTTGNLNLGSSNGINYIFSGGSKALTLATDNTERLRITSDGNVGIGASSPGSLLSVESPNTNTAETVAEFGNKTIAGGLQIETNGNLDWGFNTRNSRNLTFSTNQTERLRITSDGNVGIGTSSPSSLLMTAGTRDYTGSTPGSTSYDVNFVSGTAGLGLGQSNGVPTIQGYGAGTAYNLALCPNAGNVGIGTSDPTRLLEIAGSGGPNNTEFRLTATDGSERQIAFTGPGSTTQIIRSTGTTDNSLVIIQGPDERLRIDSSGRLLVGTSSTSADTTLVLQGTSGNPNQGAYIHLQRSSLPTTPTTPIGRINFADNSSNVGAWIQSESDAAWTSGTSHPGRLIFSTTADGDASPTERMRIDSENNILIGQTTTNLPGFGNTTEGAAFAAGGSVLCISRSDGSASLGLNRNSSDGGVAVFLRQGVVVGSISVTTTSTTYNTSSDYRLKENVVPLANAADRVNQLQVHRFNFIADPDTTVDGFLAHEAQAVVPECVTGTKDAVDDEGNPAYQGIDQSKLVPLLTAALQEALAKIETLEQRLDDAGL